MMAPFSVTTVALAAVVILFTWVFKRALQRPAPKPSKNLPPSPPRIPVIGNMHQLGSLPHRSLQSLSSRHGRDLMLLHLGSVPVVVVSSAEAAREVMKTHDLVFANRPKALAFEKLAYNCGDIATAPYGEYWRQIKSVAVLHLLSAKRVHSFRRVREEETELMVEQIRSSSGRRASVNLSELFAKLANDVVCRVSLGRKCGDSDAGADEAKRLLGEISKLAASFNVGDYFPMLSWWSRVGGLEARMVKVSKQFDEFLQGVLDKHDRHKPHQEDKDDDDDTNFVDILLRIQRENPLSFDSTAIKAILLDVFSAGIDTTFTVLESAMAQLLMHPNSMKCLQNEVRTIIGDNIEADIKNMPYLNAVLKETLRLHPPVPLLLPRVSTQDVKIMGYDVVSGSQVFINAWAIGRDPSTWDEPGEFRPERFMGSDVDYNGHDFGLIPFGAGRRGCPGIQFAMTVIEIALVNVVHRFDWSLPSSGLDMKEINGNTVHRKFPLIASPQLAHGVSNI